jgi:predicted Fe-Mo cluster-binding NifX family protein
MRIAIPVFGNRISPRCDYALHFRLFDTEEGNITACCDVNCDGSGDVERVAKLKDMGTNTLICGGLPNYLQELLTSSGIQVIPWVSGNADEVLTFFLQGRLKKGMVISPEQGRKRCRRRSNPL